MSSTGSSSTYADPVSVEAQRHIFPVPIVKAPFLEVPGCDPVSLESVTSPSVPFHEHSSMRHSASGGFGAPAPPSVTSTVRTIFAVLVEEQSWSLAVSVNV